MLHLPTLSVSTAPATMILAKGDFPSQGSLAYHLLVSAMTDAERKLYCCDGAYNRLSALNLGLPDMVIGDLDSLFEENHLELEGRICCIREQETNDLTKAVRYALRQSAQAQPLCLLATCGLREDHTLGNISLFAQYLTEGARYIVAPTSYGCFYAVPSSLSISVKQGQQLSVFNLGGKPLSSTGLKWELHEHLLPELWMGTLNQAITSEICIKASAPFILYTADECKSL